MKILLVGMNHESAPVEVRERYAVGDPEPLLGKLVACEDVDEAVILSTCNRVELCVTTHHVESATHTLLRFFERELAHGGGAPAPALDHAVYVHSGRAAAAHVLRVAASIDSMVVGEPQILGQVKDAYRAAVEAGACGPVLSRLFQRAFATAKRVKNETGIAQRPVRLHHQVLPIRDDEGLCRVVAAIEKHRADHGLADIGENAAITLRPAALFGLAKQDVLADTNGLRHLGAGLPAHKLRQTARQFALVRLGKSRIKHLGNRQTQNPVPEELKPLICRIAGSRHGACVRQGFAKQPVVLETIAKQRGYGFFIDVHSMPVNSLPQRIECGHFQNSQKRSSSFSDRKITCALPTRFSNGT